MIYNAFNFQYTDHFILLDQGWTKSVSSFFEIATEKDVFNEVFHNGSEKDYQKLLGYIHFNLSDKEKQIWASFIFTSTKKEWCKRDQALFNICYQEDQIDNIFYNTFNTLFALAERESFNASRRSRNAKPTFVQVGQEKELDESEKEKKLKEEEERRILIAKTFKKNIDNMLKNYEKAMNGLGLTLPKEYEKYEVWKSLTGDELEEDKTVKQFRRRKVIASLGYSPFKPKNKAEKFESERVSKERMKERQKAIKYSTTRRRR